MKVPSNALIPLRTEPVGRAEALRTAQRAFFHAAAGQPGAAAPKPEPAAPAPVQAQPTTAAEPQRYLRPGSRLDIKV